MPEKSPTSLPTESEQCPSGRTFHPWIAEAVDDRKVFQGIATRLRGKKGGPAETADFAIVARDVDTLKAVLDLIDNKTDWRDTFWPVWLGERKEAVAQTSRSAGSPDLQVRSVAEQVRSVEAS